MNASILHIFPPREGFGPSAFGAISLCVKDFTTNSRFRQSTHIAGMVDAPAYKGFHYHPLSLSKHWFERRSHAYLRAINELIEKLSPALIEVHNRPYLALRLAKHHTIPVALYLHNDAREMAHSKSASDRSKLVDALAAIYCVSGWVKDRFSHGLSVQETSKLHVVYPGIELPEQSPGKAKLITCIARMTPDKGVALLAQALAELLPNYPDWKAVIIGGRYHNTSTQLSSYEAQVAKIVAPLGNQVQLPGFLPFDQGQKKFSEAAIAVVPSVWQESFGRTALEAMAHGCALIGSATGGMNEVMGAAGLRQQPCDASTLVHLLRSLMDDDALLKVQQKLSKEQATKFTASACAQLLDNIREAVMRSHP